MAKATKTAATSTASGELNIVEFRQSKFEVALIGESPLILNRMTEKTKQQLLLPPKKKNAHERETSLKHDPYDEFRNSFERDRTPNAPTLLAIQASAFKGAMKQATRHMDGVKKTEIGNLTFIPHDKIGIYGMPQLFCSVTRQSDIKRTPDVRTRCIVPIWAAIVPIQFTVGKLSAQSVANLMAAAGQVSGVGDWRPEKGSGAYGRFKLVDANDPAFLQIVNTGGRSAQIAAVSNAEPYDEDTEELLRFFDKEAGKRSMNTSKGVDLHA